MLKIWVKTNMEYGEQFSLFGTWGYIHFVENPGMAFGLKFGGKTGKLLLSLFRIGAVALLIYYIRQLIKTGQPKGVLVCFSLILAGAIGNIVDSAFYGLVFSESSYHGGLAEMFPEGGGYGQFLHGKVVDMLYFPMVDTHWPDWMPFWGGDRFQFFKPVFNIADSAITTGIFSLLLFQRQFFKDEDTAKPTIEESSATAAILEEE
ncbi:MAG: lipoprotein signal peptidase [Saprospiraceae bacterium]|nr:lipoprotein signal peptidase [Saprospiraceae bacterium]